MPHLTSPCARTPRPELPARPVLVSFAGSHLTAVRPEHDARRHLPRTGRQEAELQAVQGSFTAELLLPVLAAALISVCLAYCCSASPVGGAAAPLIGSMFWLLLLLLLPIIGAFSIAPLPPPLPLPPPPSTALRPV